MSYYEQKIAALEAENARLKAEVHRLEEIVGSDAIDRKYGMCCDASDEVARLKAEVERLTAFTTRTIIPNEELQAQVERLTKYYIDPTSILRLTEDGKQEKNGFGYITKFAIEVNKDAFERLSNVMMAYWNAAKEGKPSV